MYHKFFIHSSLNGCLGCFHVLAIVNTAAVNTVSFSIMVFSGLLFVFINLSCLYRENYSLNHRSALAAASTIFSE